MGDAKLFFVLLLVFPDFALPILFLLFFFLTGSLHRNPKSLGETVAEVIYYRPFCLTCFMTPSTGLCSKIQRVGELKFRLVGSSRTEADCLEYSLQQDTSCPPSLYIFYASSDRGVFLEVLK